MNARTRNNTNCAVFPGFVLRLADRPDPFVVDIDRDLRSTRRDLGAILGVPLIHHAGRITGWLDHAVESALTGFEQAVHIPGKLVDAVAANEEGVAIHAFVSEGYSIVLVVGAIHF